LASHHAISASRAKPLSGAQQNAHPRPACADAADDARDLLDRAGGGVDIRPPQLRRKQVPAAEHVERKVAVAIVITVEEPAFLMSVQRIIGGVEIKRDLRWRFRVRVEKQVDEQCLDRGRVGGEPGVARRLRPAQFQTAQRRLAGQRRAVAASRRQLARQRRQHRIVAQLVMVDQVFVAERDADHPLHHQRLDLMFHECRVARIGETSRKSPRQPDHPVSCAEQQRTGIRRDATAVERRNHLAPIRACKPEQRCATLCRHRDAPLRFDKSLSQKNFRRFRGPVHLISVRNAG
jgi:hypothetical protein